MSIVHLPSYKTNRDGEKQISMVSTWSLRALNTLLVLEADLGSSDKSELRLFDSEPPAVNDFKPNSPSNVQVVNIRGLSRG